jgi:predicted acylesterase/phospholipase RssA
MVAAFRNRRRRPWRFLVPQAPTLLRRGGFVGLAGLLPAGLFPTAPLRRFPIDGLDRWPKQLWIPAVRLGDGRVVVFGRDRTDVPMADALEATSAVPAMFRPKQIGPDRFIDGAVASATHADLLVPRSLDRVLISSPMTRPGRGLVRSRARRQLAAEVEALRRSGAHTVVVSPDEAVMALAEGFPRTNRDAGPRIVAAARRQTLEALTAATADPSDRQRPTS